MARRALLVIAAATVLAGCGGTETAGGPTPTQTAATPTPTATPQPTTTPAPITGRGEPAAVRRAVVAWYDAQGERDGTATCALMTARGRAFYADGFKGPDGTCGGLFGPDGPRLFAVGAPYASGAFKAAQVAISRNGRTAVANALDDQIRLRKTSGRWLIDAP